MKYARLENNIVMEVIDFNPEGIFSSELAFVECPNNTQQRYIYNPETNEFTVPNEPIIEPQEPQINQDLADAYEAIASLFEQNVQLQLRLEALEGGVT